MFLKFSFFIIFSSFWKIHSPVTNTDLIELARGDLQKMKLRYDIFKVNRTKLVTTIQVIIRNTSATTKFTDVRGCQAEPIDRGSVCRAGGKPSTGFPPGTRGAEAILIFSTKFLHKDAFN